MSHFGDFNGFQTSPIQTVVEHHTVQLLGDGKTFHCPCHPSIAFGLKPVGKDQTDIFWYFPSQNTQINFIVMSYGGKLLFPKGSAPIFDDWFWSPQRDDSRILCFPRFSTEGSGSNQLQTEWNNFSNQNHSEPRIERTKTSGRSTKSQVLIWICPRFPQRFSVDLLWACCISTCLAFRAVDKVRASSRLKIKSWQHRLFLSFVLIKTIKFNFQHLQEVDFLQLSEGNLTTAITPEILKKPTANGSAEIVLSRRDVIGIIPK